MQSGAFFFCLLLFLPHKSIEDIRFFFSLFFLQPKYTLNAVVEGKKGQLSIQIVSTAAWCLYSTLEGIIIFNYYAFAEGSKC